MSRQILIVDDSSSMRQLLAMASHRLDDVEITEAGDGLDALKRLLTGRYDLMFVDLNMPVLDGLKLIRRVRTDRRHRDMRICVCTTEGDTEDQARELGADYFVKKPVSRKEVEAVLLDAFPGGFPSESPGE